jgi:hypothetical protein
MSLLLYFLTYLLPNLALYKVMNSSPLHTSLLLDRWMVRPIHLFLSTRYLNESQQNKKKQKTIYRLCPRGRFLESLLVTIFHISFARFLIY